MEAGIAAMMPGNRLTDVSHAIEKGTRGRRAAPTTAGSASSPATAGTASAGRCTWTRSCPTRVSPAAAPSLVAGSVLAIEPMLTLGTTRTRILDDEWTVVTTDGSRAAHWEHTVAVTDERPADLGHPLTGDARGSHGAPARGTARRSLAGRCRSSHGHRTGRTRERRAALDSDGQSPRSRSRLESSDRSTDPCGMNAAGDKDGKPDPIAAARATGSGPAGLKSPTGWWRSPR